MGRVPQGRRRIPLCVLVSIAIVTTSAVAQEGGEPVADPWGTLRPLEGTWEGEIGGGLGVGSGLRSYEFVLDGVFLLVRQASVRLPQPESPTGDHHRELGVYSYDAERGTLVYRQFIVEGYVLEYACSDDAYERRLVCTTERVENGSGMRARETIHLTSDHEFEETFELASPDGELELLFTNRWRRVPRLD
jgi:hypothetical protein